MVFGGCVRRCTTIRVTIDSTMAIVVGTAEWRSIGIAVGITEIGIVEIGGDTTAPITTGMIEIGGIGIGTVATMTGNATEADGTVIAPR